MILEELITLNMNLILKTTFTAVVKLQSHLAKQIKFEEGKFNKEDIDFIVQNKSVFHLYALNEEKLKPIVDYFVENNPEYLVGIVTQNKGEKENSPIEIAKRGGNVATIKIFLEALAQIGKDHVSNTFYTKLPDMIKDGIKPVQSFLETCTFQTVQMKNMVYLSMKKSGDTILIPHSSCIISNSFLNAHTNLQKDDRTLKKTQVQLQIDKDRIQKIQADINRRKEYIRDRNADRENAKDEMDEKLMGDKTRMLVKKNRRNADSSEEPDSYSNDSSESSSDEGVNDDSSDERSYDDSSDEGGDEEESDEPRSDSIYNEGGHMISNEDSHISRESNLNDPDGPFDES
jgi:hypothetical protein